MPEQVKKSLVLSINFALLISTLLVFWQVRNFDFVNYDDDVYAYENPHVLNGLTSDNVIWAFTTGFAEFWHPLTWLSLMLDRQLFCAASLTGGVNPAGFHITNLILHIANVWLVFLVLKRMTNALWQSAFAAALFALHPLHVESVAWIAQRKDVLSTFFWLLAMLAYWQYVKKPGAVRYLLVLFIFVLGLMAKPMLVTLPFVFLLLDYWPLDRIKHFQWPVLYRLVLEKIPFIILSIVSSVIAFFAQHSSGSIPSFTALPLKFRIGNALISYMKYIEQLFLPVGLTVYYPHPLENVSVLFAVISAVFLLLVTIVVIRFTKNHRYLITGWFWYLGTLVPVIGIIQVGNHAMADRYTYITFTGLFIIIAWGLPDLLRKWPQRKIILGVSMVIVLTALGICAHRQVSFWKNRVTLFSHAIEVTQDNYVAYNNLVVAFMDEGRYAEAEIGCQNLLRIKPNATVAMETLGKALSRQGKYDEAVEYYNKALQLRPDYAAAHLNLAQTLILQGKSDEAAEHLTEVLRFEPNSASAHYSLGQILAKSGKTDEAAKQFAEVLRLKPDWVEPMNVLAWVLAVDPKMTLHNPDKAVKLAQRACELTGNKIPELLDTLAVAYAAAGDFDKAVETSQKALELCQSAEQQTLKKEIENRLVLYKAGKPYVETQ